MSQGPIAWALPLVTSSTQFVTEISSPSIVAPCAQSLWVYSVQDRTIVQLSPENGRILATYSQSQLKLEGMLTAFGCFQKTNRLFLATQVSPTNTSRVHSLFLWALPSDRSPQKNPSLPQKIPIPKTGLIRDIACSDSECILLADKLFLNRQVSKNPATWAEKPSHPNPTHPSDPFSGWQSRFMNSPERYIRGIHLGSDFFILDPFRAQVIQFDSNLVPRSRWGRWGYTEGSLMSPKGLTAVGDEAFAIADAALKLIFLFGRDRTYLGTLAAGGRTGRFGYPIHLSSIGRRLFLADFFTNKVFSFNVERIPQSPPPISENQRMFEGSLFEHEEVLATRHENRCLTCHDGTELNSLDQYITLGRHHPVDIFLKERTTDLPLENGNKVTCSSCHRSHHDDQPKTAFFLRKPISQLCLSCHPGTQLPSQNHIQPDQTSSCGGCHKAHNAQDFLLKRKSPQLCVDCHSKKLVSTTHTFGKNISNCSPCHGMHHAKPSLNLARNSENPTSSTCFSCHKDKTALLGKNVHIGNIALLKHRWRKNESICLDCHNPHKERSMAAVCRQCHRVKGEHRAPISVAETEQAKGIHLKQGQVYCGTCHDPHGTSPLNEKKQNFFRDTTTVLLFCATCHGSNAEKFYRNFHGGTK